MLRASILNGKNKNYDKDFSKLLEAIATPGIIYGSGFNIVDGFLQPGKAFVEVTRASVDTFYCYVENTAAVAVDVTGTKKIWLEVKQANIDDGTLNSPDGSGIVEIKTGADYPTNNFVKIASITSGVITDERTYVMIKDTSVVWPAFNHSIKDLNDVGAFTDPTSKKYLIWDVENEQWTAGEIESIDIPGMNKSYELGDTVSNAPVSLMPDGKVYKLYNNKRLLSNGAITGQTSTKSCVFNNGEKIATLGLSGTTLTIRIGTINYGTNSISYGSGVTLTSTEGATSYDLCMLGEDKIVVGYKANSPGNVYCRVVTVSGTVPNIGTISTAVGTNFIDIIYIATDLFVITHSDSFCYMTCGSVSGTTITFGSNAGLPEYSGGNVGKLHICRYNDTKFLIGYGGRRTSNSNYYMTNLYCASISGTTISLGTGVNINNSYDVNAIPISDGVNCYFTADGNVNTTYKFTLSGTTLTQSFSIGSVSGTNIVMIPGMIGLLSSQTINRYSIGASSFVARNSINYGITPVFDTRYSTNYFIITVSGNPSYIYKISNENRKIIGYVGTGGNRGDIKPVTIDAGVVSGLSNIIPGETYYVNFSDGSISPTGDIIFGKGLSATELKLAINNVA